MQRLLQDMPPNYLGSPQRGRCRRGRSEIPHFSSKLQLFASCSRIKRKKAKKSAKKREIPAKKAKKSAKERRKRGEERFPPAPSTPTPLQTSQFFLKHHLVLSGNGRRLQAQNQEIIYLTQKRPKRDISPFYEENQK